MWKNRLKDIVLFGLILTIGYFTYYNTIEKKKLGYIDVQKVFNEFDLKKELQQKYHSKMEGKKKMIDSLGFELQKKGVELESSSKPEQQAVNNFIGKRKLYMELVKQYDEEDQKLNSDYDNQIISQMNQYIIDFGKNNGYDLIFGSMANGNIMHADEGLDLTNEVIVYINKKYAGK